MDTDTDVDTDVDIEPFCGDGNLDSDEQCDDGENNSNALPNACRTNCSFPWCGDSVVDSGEQCDDGENNSNVVPDACRDNCESPRCGDSVVDESEECEPMLDENCNSDCSMPDGVICGLCEFDDECSSQELCINGLCGEPCSDSFNCESSFLCVNSVWGATCVHPECDACAQAGNCDENCNDGIDNNGNWQIDCEDPECRDATHCSGPGCMTCSYDENCPDNFFCLGEICVTGCEVTSNCSGEEYCIDSSRGPYCHNEICPPNIQEICDNNEDDDGDGDIDCRDEECVPSCLGENCYDAIDNDGDRLIDCEDPECRHAGICNEICNDHRDNDGNGLIDCDDPECQSSTICTIDEICNDGEDNDEDRFIDCEDDECFGDPSCPITNEICDNNEDDDGNGDIDCDDLACELQPECCLGPGCGMTCEDPNEPNDFDDLTEIEEFGIYFGGICDPEDEDGFIIEMNDSFQLNILAPIVDAPLPLDISTHLPDFVLNRIEFQYGVQFTIDNVLGVLDYELQIKSLDNMEGQFPYRIGFVPVISGCENDVFEPNDTLEDAVLIMGKLNGSIILCGDEWDFFSLGHLSASTEIRYNIASNASVPADLDINILHNGNVVNYVPSSGDGTFSTREAGEYYVRVKSYRSDYNIEVELFEFEAMRGF